MVTRRQRQMFSSDAPADLEHAPLIREEALDWLEAVYPEAASFTASDLLHMTGEQGRRWLITRLRANGIGEEKFFSPPVAADAVTVLFLRSKGVKFAEAIQAIRAGQRSQSVSGPAYGGVWSRLMVVSMDRLKRLMPARLLSTAVAALLNAASGDVSYPLTTIQIIQKFNDALANNTLEATKNELEALNESSCDAKQGLSLRADPG